MAVDQEKNPIKHFRHARGISQAELAEKMGIASSTLSAMEKADANVTIGTLERAITAMGGRLALMAQFEDGPVKHLPGATG